MDAFNISDTNDGTEYKFKSEQMLIEHVLDFKQKLSTEGMVSKAMVLSLEEFLNENIITEILPVNAFTTLPSQTYVGRLQKHLNTIVNEKDLVSTDITVYDIMEIITYNMGKLRDLRNELLHIADSIDLDKLSYILKNENRVYDHDNKVVDLTTINMVDFVLNYSEAYKIFNNHFIEVIREKVGDDIGYETIFLRLADIGLKVERDPEAYFDMRDIVLNEFKYLTIGEFTHCVNNMYLLKNAFKTIEDQMARFIRYYSDLDDDNVSGNDSIAKTHKMLTMLKTVLDEDETISYMRLFTK